MRSRNRLIMLLGWLTLVLAGCGGAPAAAPLRVAMILPGPIDDFSWNQSGFEALQRMQRELGAAVTYQENVAPAAFAAQFRALASAGNGLVIGHGAQLYAAASTVAPEFPQTKFVVVSDDPGNGANLSTVSFRNAETGYLVGLVAALKTTSLHIAYIGGVANSAQQAAYGAVVRGAHAVNPAITVDLRWVDSWTDQAVGALVARAALRQGADVLI